MTRDIYIQFGEKDPIKITDLFSETEFKVKVKFENSSAKMSGFEFDCDLTNGDPFKLFLK